MEWPSIEIKKFRQKIWSCVYNCGVNNLKENRHLEKKRKCTREEILIEMHKERKKSKEKEQLTFCRCGRSLRKGVKEWTKRQIRPVQSYSYGT